MAKEYIEREALITQLNHRLDSLRAQYGYYDAYTDGFDEAVERVEDTAPAADVVEVKHGEWEIKSESIRLIDDYDEEIYIECPFCGRRYYNVSYEFDDAKILEYARKYYPYCNCGAKMDGERKEQG